jgi:hypothetical protein
MKPVKIRIFDFDDPAEWKKVLAVVDRPFVLRALDAGMNALCSCSEKKWDRQLGPWRYSRKEGVNWSILNNLLPQSNNPFWYRISGGCNSIAPWCGAVGSVLFPNHQWYYANNQKVPEYGCHSAGIGFKEGKQPSLIIMDILFGQQVLRDKTKNWLVNILAGENAKHIPLIEAIKRLESGHFTKPLTNGK